MRSDDADLDWFFSTGVSAFERSTFGYALEKAQAYYAPREPAKVLTARPSNRREVPQAAEPDQGVMEKHGNISRRLSRVCAVDSVSRAVLELWHGDVGASWAEFRHGRCIALFVMTPSGKRLLDHLRRVAVGPSVELTDKERLRSAMVLDEIAAAKPDGSKGAEIVALCKPLIVSAVREAHGLHQRAMKVWRMCG